MSNVPLPPIYENHAGKWIDVEDARAHAAAVSAAKDAGIAQLRADLIKSLADNKALRDERDNMAGAIAQLLHDNRDVHEKVVRPLRERVRVLEDARPEPDCRTCEGFVACARRTAIPSTGDVGCTNGGRYEPLPPVRLWRPRAASASS